jgi:hypothetical protein
MKIIVKDIVNIVDEIALKYNDKYLYTGNKLNIYVSNEIMIKLKNILIYSYMNFICDNNRKNLEYGYTLKSEVVSNVNYFFYG